MQEGEAKDDMEIDVKTETVPEMESTPKIAPEQNSVFTLPTVPTDPVQFQAFYMNQMLLMYRLGAGHMMAQYMQQQQNGGTATVNPDGEKDAAEALAAMRALSDQANEVKEEERKKKRK